MRGGGGDWCFSHPCDEECDHRQLGFGPEDVLEGYASIFQNHASIFRKISSS